MTWNNVVNLEIRAGERIISLQFILPCSCEDGLDAFSGSPLPLFSMTLRISGRWSHRLRKDEWFGLCHQALAEGLQDSLARY